MANPQELNCCKTIMYWRRLCTVERKCCLPVATCRLVASSWYKYKSVELGLINRSLPSTIRTFNSVVLRNPKRPDLIFPLVFFRCLCLAFLGCLSAFSRIDIAHRVTNRYLERSSVIVLVPFKYVDLYSTPTLS